MKPGKMPHGKNVRYRSDLKDYEAKKYVPSESVLGFIFYPVEELKKCTCIAKTAL